MNKKIIQSSLEEVAANEGISTEEVKQEIESAIADALSNPDPQIQLAWKHIPCKGEVPTPEEVISYISTKLINMENDNLS